MFAEKTEFYQIPEDFDNFTIDPSGAAWISTSIGKLHKCDSISDNWHEQIPPRNQRLEYKAYNNTLNEIMFLTPEIFIAYGKISMSHELLDMSQIVRSEDRGKHWNLIELGEFTSINSSYILDENNVWMGGSSGTLFYSNDSALSFSKIDLGAEINSIFMKDASFGIIAISNKEFLVTYDNWKNYDKFDYPVMEIDSINAENNSKVGIWNDRAVLLEKGKLFYSELEDLKWIELENNITDIQISDNLIYAISDSSKILKIPSQDQMEFLPTNINSAEFLKISMANERLYVMDNQRQIHDITELEVNSYPKIEFGIMNNFQLVSGMFHRNRVFVYRNKILELTKRNNVSASSKILASFDFDIKDLRVLDEGIFKIWDFKNRCYVYNANNGILQPFLFDSPLTDFLKHPITALTIRSNTAGCFNYTDYEITYTVKGEKLYCTNYQAMDDGMEDHETRRYRNSVKMSKLDRLLHKINSNPYAIPKFSDYKISQHQIDHPIDPSMVERDEESKMSQTYYDYVPRMMGKWSEMPISNFALRKKIIEGTFSSSFWIEITNSIGTTINIHESNIRGIGVLPWEISCKKDQLNDFGFNGVAFDSYSIELTDLIRELLPKNFHRNTLLDNRFLMYRLWLDIRGGRM